MVVKGLTPNNYIIRFNLSIIYSPSYPLNTYIEYSGNREWACTLFRDHYAYPKSYLWTPFWYFEVFIIFTLVDCLLEYGLVLQDNSSFAQFQKICMMFSNSDESKFEFFQYSTYSTYWKYKMKWSQASWLYVTGALMFLNSVHLQILLQKVNLKKHEHINADAEV